MKPREIRELSNEEMKVELKNLREGLFKLRFRQVAENTRHASEETGLRRDIARVLTVMRQRELEAKKEGK